MTLCLLKGGPKHVRRPELIATLSKNVRFNGMDHTSANTREMQSGQEKHKMYVQEKQFMDTC